MTTELTQPALSAGQRLRQAREQQNLTVAQVAQQLNLSKSLIDDLELDQVDAKLSSTFVRGYLRSYAKLLKIPAQQILDAYTSNSKGLHQVPSLTRSFSKRTAKEATENRFIWVTYFVIAVFVVLLVFGFWQSRFGSSASGSALPMAQTDETMLASEDAKPAQTETYQPATESENAIPVTQLQHSSSVPSTSALTTQPQAVLAADAPVLPEPEQNTSSETTSTPTGTEPSQTEIAVTDAAVLPQQVDAPQPAAQTPQPETLTTEPAPAVETNQPATEPSVSNSEPATPATTEADTAANATISLSLTAECWVDVVDATGKRLVFGSRQPGEQLNLRGVAPVKVLLGNAAAATLSFNGEVVDLSGYPTGRVARLTLGQN